MSVTTVNNAPFTYYTGCANTSGCTTPAGTTNAFSVILTVTSSNPVANPSPTASDYLHSVILPPLCPTSATDIPTCQVKLPGGTGGQNTPTGHVGGNWSATSSESVLFRIGDVETTQAQCQEYLAITTYTMTVDGSAVPFVRLPCVVVPAGEVGFSTDATNLWWTDARYLSAPLSPGTHTATTTFVFNAPFTYTAGCTNAAGCTTPSGATNTFSVIVTVS
jgi:hypothetical protein